MILTAHQPAYLPWLGLFHKIALADKYVFFDDVQYDPEDWVQRNCIKTTTGTLMLTVPMLRQGRLDKKISEMEIQNEKPWMRKHWRSIYENYSKAPHFKLYADFFEDLYKRQWVKIADLNLYMLRWFLKTLDINTSIELGSANAFSGKKSDLVLDMCKKLGASIFIFGAQGEDYADKEKFLKNGVTPVFQKYNHPTYDQLNGEFKSHMCVLDLLFNMGPRSLEIIMSDNIKRTTLREASRENESRI